MNVLIEEHWSCLADHRYTGVWVVEVASFSLAPCRSFSMLLSFPRRDDSVLLFWRNIVPGRHGQLRAQLTRQQGIAVPDPG